MRIVFMGTPDFAEASLKKLLDCGEEVVAVFTQPDKPKGRGMEMSYPPVKELALQHGIPVYQPVKMRDGTALELIKACKPDILVVVAYGRILPDDILAVPVYGAINVHGSLLPKYRGSAPIQWSVLNGDEKTGVTIMYLASECDAGDIICSEETAIGEYETSGELFDRLKDIGAELLVKTLKAIENGTAARTPQDHSRATHAAMLDKSLCPIDWTKPARGVIKWVCGMQPWPVATMEIEGVVCKVFSAEYGAESTDKAPGTLIRTVDKGLEVACGSGTVIVKEIQAAGKKRMTAADYLNGRRIKL